MQEFFQHATVKYFHEDGLSGEEREVPHCAAAKGTGCKAQGCTCKDAAERSGNGTEQIQTASAAGHFRHLATACLRTSKIGYPIKEGVS